MSEAKRIISEMMKLMEEGILVRNTKDDDNFDVFFKQGIRITKMLKAAQELLTNNKEI